jgi:predicted peroxiredoxin
MAKTVLIIIRNGPEDPNGVTAAFLTAKACSEKGMDVSLWLYNNAVYLIKEGTPEQVQAFGLPPFEDLLLDLTTVKEVPIYVGISCAVSRGLCDTEQKPIVKFVAGKLASPSKLAELIFRADNVISF